MYYLWRLNPDPVAEGSVSTDEVAMPFVKALSEFRDEVRTSARELKAHDILKKCDNLRDNVLPELGVRLEDRELGEPAVFKVTFSDLTNICIYENFWVSLLPEPRLFYVVLKSVADD